MILKRYTDLKKKSTKFFGRVLAKFTIREKHLRGSLAHKIFGDYIFSKEFWIPSRKAVATGVAIGLFFGMLPIFGFQIISAVAVALFLRANISAAVLATWITNPITFPGVLWFEKIFGDWIISTSLWKKSHLTINVQLPYFAKYGEPLLVGSILSGIIASLTGFFIVTILWDGINLIIKKCEHL